MANVHIMDHPLIHHKLAVLRNKETPVKEFRAHLARLRNYQFQVSTFHSLVTVQFTFTKRVENTSGAT